MYYVSWIREYPIFEPAEGGYYYAGEQVFYCKEYPTWKKANRAYQKLKKEFAEYCGWADECTGYLHHQREINFRECGGCGKYVHSFVRRCSKYVGKGEWIQITRRRPVDRGRVPYC